MLTAVRARMPRGEGGMSLAELLIAMTVTTVMLAVVTGLLIVGAKTVATTKCSSASASVASTALDAISQVVRFGTTATVFNVAGVGTPGAPPVVQQPAFGEATPDSFVVYAYQTAGSPGIPEQIEFSIDDSGTLRRSTWGAVEAQGGTYWTYPPTSQAPDSSSIVASGIRADASQPYFSYSDTNGNDIAEPVAASALGSVAEVTANLTVSSQCAADGKVSSKTTVAIQPPGAQF